ncbi:hypothetical protein [Calidifontibacter terrae]
MTTILGDPEKVRIAATTLSDRAEALASHAGTTRCQQAASMASWGGTAALQFGCAARLHASDADSAADQLRPLAADLRRFAGALERHQSSERLLLAKLDAAERDLRDARTALRLGPLDPTATSPADVTAAVALVRRLTHDLEQVRSDHRTSLRALHFSLTTYTPPTALWRRGMEVYGMGLAYWNLFQKGGASYWLWKTRSPVTDPALASRRIGALTVIEKGTVTGFLEKGWMSSVFRGRAGGVLLKTVRALSGIGTAEAMVPGARDVITGGGYTGWRDPATRAMGLVEISGVLVSRNPETKLGGALMLTTYAVWKAGNKAYDNKENLSDNTFWESTAQQSLQDERDHGMLGPGGVLALWWLENRAETRLTGQAAERIFVLPRRPVRVQLPYGPPAPWHPPVRTPRTGEADPFARFQMVPTS